MGQTPSKTSPGPSGARGLPGVNYIRRPEYIDYHLIQDVGSGIHFKRKGIQTILDACIRGTIGEIVIAHRDRVF